MAKEIATALRAQVSRRHTHFDRLLLNREDIGMMKSRRALVTGGAGFIGSHLCDHLIERGYVVFCVDNLYSGSAANISHLQSHPNFVFVNSDVSTVSELEVSEIYNLACPASPVHYQSNPMYTVHTSVNGAIRMATLAQKLKIKLFQASTSEVYGDPTVHPQPESYWGNVNPIGPRACYDESKRIAEAILFILHHQQPYGLKLGRIFNTYGPRMLVDDGRVISNFINQALQNEDVTIYGDGSQTRSFCYIDDLIDAIFKFMNSDDKVVGPINLGNQAEFSVQDLAKYVIELTGSRSKIIYSNLPIDDPSRRRPNISLAKEVLGWEPKVSLEEGLKKTIAYYQNLRPLTI